MHPLSPTTPILLASQDGGQKRAIVRGHARPRACVAPLIQGARERGSDLGREIAAEARSQPYSELRQRLRHHRRIDATSIGCQALQHRQILLHKCICGHSAPLLSANLRCRRFESLHRLLHGDVTLPQAHGEEEGEEEEGEEEEGRGGLLGEWTGESEKAKLACQEDLAQICFSIDAMSHKFINIYMYIYTSKAASFKSLPCIQPAFGWTRPSIHPHTHTHHCRTHQLTHTHTHTYTLAHCTHTHTHTHFKQANTEIMTWTIQAHKQPSTQTTLKQKHLRHTKRDRQSDTETPDRNSSSKTYVQSETELADRDSPSKTTQSETDTPDRDRKSCNYFEDKSHVWSCDWFIYVYKSIYIHTYICVYFLCIRSVYMNIYIYITSIYVCMYIYIHMYMYIYIYCFFCFFFLGGGGWAGGSGKLGSGMLWFQVCVCVCVCVLFSLLWACVVVIVVDVHCRLSLFQSLSLSLSLCRCLSLSHVAGAMQSNMLSCSRCDAIQHAASTEHKFFSKHGQWMQFNMLPPMNISTKQGTGLIMATRTDNRPDRQTHHQKRAIWEQESIAFVHPYIDCQPSNFPARMGEQNLACMGWWHCIWGGWERGKAWVNALECR